MSLCIECLPSSEWKVTHTSGEGKGKWRAFSAGPYSLQACPGLTAPQSAPLPFLAPASSCAVHCWEYEVRMEVCDLLRLSPGKASQ